MRAQGERTMNQFPKIQWTTKAPSPRLKDKFEIHFGPKTKSSYGMSSVKSKNSHSKHLDSFISQKTFTNNTKQSLSYNFFRFSSHPLTNHSSLNNEDIYFINHSFILWNEVKLEKRKKEREQKKEDLQKFDDTTFQA